MKEPRQRRHERHGHTRGVAQGQKVSPTYNSWRKMIGRCTSPNQDGWKHYGGRGITVCDRWRSFQAFLDDMGERPEGCTLDRIDPDGHYEPGNCRWATKEQQITNMNAFYRQNRDLFEDPPASANAWTWLPIVARERKRLSPPARIALDRLTESLEKLAASGEALPDRAEQEGSE